MKRWRVQILTIGAAVGAAALAAYFRFIRQAAIDPGGVIFGAIFGAGGGVMMDISYWQPVTFRRIGRATVDVRFRNGAFTKLYRDATDGGRN